MGLACLRHTAAALEAFTGISKEMHCNQNARSARTCVEMRPDLHSSFPTSETALPQDANAQLEQWQRDIVDFGHEKRGVEAELGAVEAECAQHMAQVGAGRCRVCV